MPDWYTPLKYRTSWYDPDPDSAEPPPGKNLHMSDNPNEPFFNRQFWRMTLIASFSQIIVLVIALTASMLIGGKIDSLANLFATANETLVRVETSINAVMGVDPAELQEKANALRDSATEVGVGVGDGGSEVVDRVGDAFDRWKARQNNGDQ